MTILELACLCVVFIVVANNVADVSVAQFTIRLFYGLQWRKQYRDKKRETVREARERIRN